MTPPLGACCKGAGETCAPDHKLWAVHGWEALRFSIDDPHRFSYEYVAAPDGKSFTARAHGDLDCDGEYSTFEMVGTILGDGSVSGSAGMFKARELE